MAEFCKACSEDLFGPGYNDAKGITDQASWDKDLACLFLCEGCGFIQVDPEGNCISKDCLKQGEKGHGVATSMDRR